MVDAEVVDAAARAFDRKAMGAADDFRDDAWFEVALGAAIAAADEARGLRVESMRGLLSGPYKDGLVSGWRFVGNGEG